MFFQSSYSFINPQTYIPGEVYCFWDSQFKTVRRAAYREYARVACSESARECFLNAPKSTSLFALLHS